MKNYLALGWQDVAQTIKKKNVVQTLGWNDIATRYRRSRIGPFWLTINLGVMIACVGLVFGKLFGSPVDDFLPFFCVGMILWTFIASCLIEGCNAYQEGSGIILQIKMPLWIHVSKIMYRNIIIIFHNILIIPICLIIYGRSLTSFSLIAIPGFILLVVNILWMMTILAVVCARFRDVNQILTNIIQVLYFVTPIMWGNNFKSLSIPSALYEWNPFFHLLNLVRAPILNQLPSMESWIVASIMAIVGVVFSLVFYGKFIKRVPYWL